MTDATSKVRTTVAEYLALPETNRLIELLDGEIIVHPPPSDPHQKVSLALTRFLLESAPEGTIRVAPIGLYVDDHNYVEPDLFWVSAENTRCVLIDNQYWHGGPDLVIEILSSSTAYHDNEIKYALYQQIGVREYWIVDPDVQTIAVYRQADDQFVSQGTFQTGQSFESDALSGVLVEIDPLFAD